MLRTQINDALKDAMRAKDEIRTGAVRLMINEMKKRDIEARPKGNADGIADAEIISMLQGMIKQRRESIELYQKGNRQDLVDTEQGEIDVIEKFLPQQMTAAETTNAIDKVAAELGATGIKDMGKVMAELKTRYAGQMDFGAAGVAVKRKLAG